MVIIRMASEADLPTLLTLENLVYKDPWTEAMFRQELTTNEFAYVTVLVLQNVIMGYACFWIIGDEAMLNNLTVFPALQGKGLGQIILTDTLNRMRTAGCHRVTLEVRISNARAIHLYEKNGFKTLSIRRKYYLDGEDAYVMALTLEGGESDEQEVFIGY